SYKIDFSPGGLTINEHSVGNAVNAIQTAHIPSFSPIAAALFYQPTVQALGAVYDSLSGEGIAAVEQTAISSNDLFHTSILNQARYWMADNEGSDPNSLTFYSGGAQAYAAMPDAGFAKAPSGVPLGQRTWRVWSTVNGSDWRFSGDPVVGSAKTSASGAGI